MTRDEERPSPDLGRLDAELAALRFEPRASLGPEVVGRHRQGERAAPARRWSTATFTSRRRNLVGLAAALMLATGLAARGAFGPTAQAALVDHCCIDLDGQDMPDDGLLIESTHGGDRVRKLTVYEDLDGDGHFSPGDRIVFSRSGAPALAPPSGDGLRVKRFCCVDYDGGGPADDGLLVVNAPGGSIVLAAIYETAPRPGSAPPEQLVLR